MAHIQLSLYGKTSWERFLQMTGWILEPLSNPSQIPKFQCLLLENGQPPEWCEGERLTSHGGSWTPDTGESPRPLKGGEESLSWRILEANAPEKYYLSPALCTRLLKLAQITGIQPPPKIEYLLMKQGGKYPLSIPFKTGASGEPQRKKTGRGSLTASDDQMTLFPPC
jgi:hypothetical protein